MTLSRIGASKSRESLISNLADLQTSPMLPASDVRYTGISKNTAVLEITLLYRLV